MFTPDYNTYFADVIPANPMITDPNGVEDIVQFSEPCYDVITGQLTNTSIYLLDGGAIFSNSVALLTNTAPGERLFPARLTLKSARRRLLNGRSRIQKMIQRTRRTPALLLPGEDRLPR